MSSFTVITLGCPKNIVDSRHLIYYLKAQSFVYVEDFKKANFILINTCCFIDDAKEESIDEILTVAKFKEDKKLIVFGCLAKRYSEELKKQIPEIDAVFGLGEKEKVATYMKSFTKEKTFINSDNYNAEPASYRYLKIAEGCSRRCSFCIIPDIRGPFKSINPESILKEAEGFVKEGVKELILVAQDITQYGKDLKGYNLKNLIKDLSSLQGDFWIRLLYMYPTEIDEALIEVISEENKVVKYLDIPLQHSEDRILRLMGRRGTKKDYLKLIRRLRQAIPGVTLRTTFIVGFPTETEEEFQNLLDFIEEVHFDRLGAFIYSPQEGTKAYSLKNQIPQAIKKRRYHELMSKQALISLEKNRTLVGKDYDALIDYIDTNLAIARLYCHAPEVDGVVMLEDIKEAKVGDRVKVLITEAYEYDLKGVII
ncbi:MAG: 30S ribosomal protein S12 methylthiotransferase RimO [Thermodesulfovibrio sp.]|nr:30S ribosomal protein S12 methylthiotransferase RimO [Thermodesulfovibrio sp.]